MKVRSVNWPIAAAALLCCLQAAAADAEQACPVKGKPAAPTAFLLDKSGAIVKGPIDFGTYTSPADFSSDYLVHPTQYRILLFPARIQPKPEHCNVCLSLTKSAPLCPNSTTYEVGVGLVFRGGRASISPYRIDSEAVLEFNDAKLDYDPNVKTAFDARIVGVLVQTQ